METDVIAQDIRSQSLNQEAGDQGQVQEVDVEAMIAQRIEAATLKLKSEINGLNQRNSNLDTMLASERGNKTTVEDRLHQLENERATDRIAKAELEAFVEAKIDGDWLKPFQTSDPFERATLVKELLENHERQITDRMSKTLGSRSPLQYRKTPDKERFSSDDLRGLSPAEINKLWDAGKVAGV